MSHRRLLSRSPVCRLSAFPPASAEMIFQRAQQQYIERLMNWLGDPAVVAHHTSKSCRFPLVRGADGVLVGYNCYDYVVFVPRSIWKRLPSSFKCRVSVEQLRWHPSYTEWKPGHGERLLVGSIAMVEALVSAGVVRPEHPGKAG